jgi:hypothetical protein
VWIGAANAEGLKARYELGLDASRDVNVVFLWQAIEQLLVSVSD